MELEDCIYGKIYLRIDAPYEYLWKYNHEGDYISIGPIKIISQARFEAYPNIKVLREASFSETLWFERCTQAKRILPLRNVLNIYGLRTEK